MQYPFRFYLLLLLTVLLPASRQIHAQGFRCRDGDREQPFLVFLDDLRAFPWGTSQRDPFAERMETERHDFTQSTKTVGRGVLQLEGGYLYLYKDDGREIEHLHAMPEILLRIGLSDDIEFRVRWDYAWQLFEEEPDLDSALDLVWSLKLGFTEQRGCVPESALEIRSSVPTGGAAFTLGRVEAGFDYIYGWRLSRNWALYGSTGWLGGGLGDFSLLPDEPQEDRFGVATQSVAVSTELTEDNTLYAEWYGLFSHNLADNFSLSFFNVGLDHYFTDNLLIDFRVGVGLTEDSEDMFAGVGGGVRF